MCVLAHTVLKRHPREEAVGSVGVLCATTLGSECWAVCFCQSLPVCFLTRSEQRWQFITERKGTVGVWSSAGFVYGSGPSLTRSSASC